MQKVALPLPPLDSMPVHSVSHIMNHPLPAFQHRLVVPQAAMTHHDQIPFTEWSADQVKALFMKRFPDEYASFEDLSGNDLSLLSEAQMRTRSPKRGDVIFAFVQQLVNQTTSPLPSPSSSSFQSPISTYSSPTISTYSSPSYSPWPTDNYEGVEGRPSPRVHLRVPQEPNYYSGFGDPHHLFGNIPSKRRDPGMGSQSFASLSLEPQQQQPLSLPLQPVQDDMGNPAPDQVDIHRQISFSNAYHIADRVLEDRLAQDFNHGGYNNNNQQDTQPSWHIPNFHPAGVQYPEDKENASAEWMTASGPMPMPMPMPMPGPGGSANPNLAMRLPVSSGLLRAIQKRVNLESPPLFVVVPPAWRRESNTKCWNKIRALLSRFGKIACKTWSGPDKEFCEVQFSYWTDLETRQRVLADGGSGKDLGLRVYLGGTYLPFKLCTTPFREIPGMQQDDE